MRHPTYKHLEAPLRLGSFSLGQWAQITAAGIAAAAFGAYLSPFPTTVTIFVAIVGAGLPGRPVLRGDGPRVLGRRVRGRRVALLASPAALPARSRRAAAPATWSCDEPPATTSGGPAPRLGEREPLWDL